MLQQHGDADMKTRKTLAKEAFTHTSEYDAAISAYLTKQLAEGKIRRSIMQILLIGSGGREHALAWKLAQSGQVEKIFAAPGNPGIAAVEKCECVELNLNDLDSVADFAEEHGIDLTVVGPEATLVAGIADCFCCKRACCIRPFQSSGRT